MTPPAPPKWHGRLFWLPSAVVTRQQSEVVIGDIVTWLNTLPPCEPLLTLQLGDDDTHFAQAVIAFVRES